MTRVLPRLQTCFQFILYIFLCIFIHLPPPPPRRRHRRRCRRRHPRRRCHRLRLEKTLNLPRSQLSVCLEVGTSAVKHHCFFLEYYIAILSFESDRNFRSSPHATFATPARNRSCRHFSFPWCTPYVNVKLSGACAELKITYQLYGLSIRNPIRKVRIAEPLYYPILCHILYVLSEKKM